VCNGGKSAKIAIEKKKKNVTSKAKHGRIVQATKKTHKIKQL
jgi:hypothetical protein